MLYVTDSCISGRAVEKISEWVLRGEHIYGTCAAGSPAVVRNHFGRGEGVHTATYRAIPYAKDAKFVPAEPKEKWPAAQREFINLEAARAKAPRLVELSHQVVEAGLYDAKAGTALVLANFTYQPIKNL